MPTFAAGHSLALFNALTSPRFTLPDPPAPPQSRRKSTPPVAPLDRSLASSRPCNARKPPGHRQIPIDRTARTAEYKRPAVSSPEACRTPAGRGQAPHPSVSGRCPTTLNTSRRKSAAGATSAFRGIADEIRQKADVRALTSGAEGRADHLGGTSGRGIVATRRHPANLAPHRFFRSVLVISAAREGRR